jgi:hypothetical protein
MRIDAIDDATWSTISAQLLAGNTYGLPDRVVELSATCGRFDARSSGDLGQFDAWMETDTRITGCGSDRAI